MGAQFEDSPFASRLHTDFIPRGGDVDAIREIIDQKNLQLLAVEDEIRPVEVLYNQLQARRTAIHLSLDGHRALISPIRLGEIPEDILREIFLCCLSSGQDVIMDPMEPPLLFMQVCSAWRRLALATPQLWSSLFILLNRNWEFQLPGPEKNQLPQIQDWLSRSLDCPLSLTLIDETASSSNLDVFGFMLSMSKRWKSLRISIVEDKIGIFEDLGPGDLSTLTNLEISIRPREISWGGSVHNTLPISTLILAPNLRHLKIGFIVAGRVDTLQFKWTNLTSLTLAQVGYPATLPDVILFLKTCSQLVYFSIHYKRSPMNTATFQTTEPNLEEVSDTANIPYLTTLKISSMVQTVSSTSFQGLSMPSLEEFTYNVPVNENVPTPLILLLRSQKSPLRSLTISVSSFSEDELIECLEYCTHLTRLHFLPIPDIRSRGWGHNDPLSDNLLRRLSIPQSSGMVLCPILKVLENSAGSKGWSDDEIFNFIKRKQSGIPEIAKLKRFAVNFDRVQEHPLAAKLQPYIDDGLDVAFQYMLNNRAFRNKTMAWTIVPEIIDEHLAHDSYNFM